MVLFVFVLVFLGTFFAFAGAPPSGRDDIADLSGTAVEFDPVACAEMPEPENRVCDFGPMFNLAGREHEMDPRLLAAVAFAESGFAADVIDCTRSSEDGAMGLMQFMPGTAAERGVDPCDPADAIFGAAEYLKEMYDELDDWELAVAGYNAGPQAVRDVGGIPQNGETELYVPKVMDKWDEYKRLFPGAVGGCPQANPSGSTEPIDQAHITQATRELANAVIACFGRDGDAIGCFAQRPGDKFEHPRGRACDFMIDDRSRGDAMAAWVQANHEELNVLYVIWWRRIWDPSMGDIPWEEWEPYNGASPHTDHVHVSVKLMPGDPAWAECPHSKCSE